MSISGSNSMSGVCRECYYELVALPSSAIIQFYKQRQVGHNEDRMLTNFHKYSKFTDEWQICTVQVAIFDGQGDMMSGKLKLILEF